MEGPLISPSYISETNQYSNVENHIKQLKPRKGKGSYLQPKHLEKSLLKAQTKLQGVRRGRGGAPPMKAENRQNM